MNIIEIKGEEVLLNGNKVKHLKSFKIEKTSPKECDVTLKIKAIVQGKNAD